MTLIILGDSPEVFRMLASSEKLNELFVMRDNDKLKRPLLTAEVDNVHQSVSKSLHIVSIQVSGRLVKCNDPTVEAKGLSQRKPNN